VYYYKRKQKRDNEHMRVLDIQHFTIVFIPENEMLLKIQIRQIWRSTKMWSNLT
jgi:hypothetical protein